MTKYIQIALVVLKIDIKKESKVINDILESFKSISTKKSDGLIIFKEAKNKSIKINFKNHSVEVLGPNFDDFSDPLLPIMLMQIIFRFADFLSTKQPQFLLHASTATWFDDRAILFGDDGTNIGKTTASLELGLRSKGYVCDEFCVYEVASNLILDFPNLPIHIRSEYLKDLNSRGILTKSCSKYDDLYALSDFGIKPKVNAQLSMIIYPKFSLRSKSKVKYLSEKIARKKFEILAFSHMAKFIYPKYDRASWLTNNDITQTFDMETDCKKLSFGRMLYAEQIFQKIPSYSITFQKPSQIFDLVNSAVIMEQNRIVNHLSASAVVYFKKKDGIKILLLKKNNGLIFLPKGHVNKGEKPSETALREAKEETGLISGKIEKKIGEYSYTFIPEYGFATHKKRVVSYLIEGKKIKPQALEVEGFSDVFFVSLNEAVKLCSFEDEKKMITKAFSY